MPEKIALVTGANGGLGTHVTKALLDAIFTVVGLAPKIQQSDFDHPNFIALPATLTSLDTAKQAVATRDRALAERSTCWRIWLAASPGARPSLPWTTPSGSACSTPT